MGYFITPKADADLDEIADSLVDHAGLDFGLRFIAQAYRRFELLSTQPEMGWPCRVQHKQLSLARVFTMEQPFEKYLIFYQPNDLQIKILRVLHGAQDLPKRLAEEGVLGES